MLFNIVNFLTKKEKNFFFLLVFLSFVLSIFELAGIMSIIPFLSILIEPNNLEKFTFIQNFLSEKHTNEKSIRLILGSLFITIIFLSSLLNIFNIWLTNKFVVQLEYDLAKKILKGFLGRNLDYYSNINSSQITSKVLEETTRVTNGVINSYLNLISKSLLILVINLGLIVINPKITISLALILFFIFFIIYFFTRQLIKKNGKKISKLLPIRQKKLFEGIESFRELKIYNKEYVILDVFNLISNKVAKLKWLNSSLALTPRYLIEFLTFFIIVVLLIFFSNNNFYSMLPIFGVFIFSFYKMLPAAQNIYISLAQIRGDISALDNIKDEIIFEKKISQNKNKLKQKKLPFDNLIKLKNINFSYSNKLKIFTNFNFDIKRGEKIGIKGKSVVGKSTLINLICGFYKVSKGQIIIDKTKLTENNIMNWQKNICYVPQKVYLFDNTILNNITFFDSKKNINKKILNKISKNSMLNEFTKKMKKKLYSNIGDRASKLSGGQAQRIGIARAMYSNAELIILDESTNSLDKKTEKKIIKNFFTLKKDKTIIIVSHHENNLKYCDKIIDLDNLKK